MSWVFKILYGKQCLDKTIRTHSITDILSKIQLNYRCIVNWPHTCQWRFSCDEKKRDRQQIELNLIVCPVSEKPKMIRSCSTGLSGKYTTFVLICERIAHMHGAIKFCFIVQEIPQILFLYHACFTTKFYAIFMKLDNIHTKKITYLY